MTAAHTGVDDLDVPHILVLTLLMDLVQLLAHFLCLRGFGQVILPAHLPCDSLFIGDALFLGLVPCHLVHAAPIGKNALVFALVDEKTA